MLTYDNERNGVLELAGDGSRTESDNITRLMAQLEALNRSEPAEPATPRKRELIWGLIACFLLMAWLDGGNLAAQIVDERQFKIRYLPALTHPASVANCERNTRVAVAALNAWEITEGEVKVACRRVKS